MYATQSSLSKYSQMFAAIASFSIDLLRNEVKRD